MKTSVMTFSQAIGDGIVVEMERDPNVYVAGEDVWGARGGNFLVTKAPYEKFGPARVLDTPISETAILGHAVGAAMVGLRPIVEIMFVDFMGVCFDELMNQAAKLRYMTGGQVDMPLVIRCADGAGLGAAAQHSQSLEGLLTHIPGLKVVCASTPAEAKGLLTSAVRDDNPVVFLEHKGLYGLEGDVPEGEHLVPLGKADVKREGADVTIVTWSAMVHEALRAAQLLSGDGVDVEVVDLRSLVPLDTATILESVGKTHRVVIVHEAARTCGFGAEVSALMADEGFDLLDAPVRRVTGLDTPIPFSPPLEAECLPNADKIRAAVVAGLN